VRLAFALCLSALVGASLGSFLDLVHARVPEGRSVVRPASACPACGRPLAWFENVPVLAWLALRGRCRTCRSPIPTTALAAEAGSALLCLLAVAGAWGSGPLGLVGASALALTGAGLAVAPDGPVPLLAGGLGLAGLACWAAAGALGEDSSTRVLTSLLVAAAGCLAGGLLLAARRRRARSARRRSARRRSTRRRSTRPWPLVLGPLGALAAWAGPHPLTLGLDLAGLVGTGLVLLRAAQLTRRPATDPHRSAPGPGAPA
jgi:hypothetical protein